MFSLMGTDVLPHVCPIPASGLKTRQEHATRSTRTLIHADAVQIITGRKQKAAASRCRNAARQITVSAKIPKVN